MDFIRKMFKKDSNETNENENEKNKNNEEIMDKDKKNKKMDNKKENITIRSGIRSNDSDDIDMARTDRDKARKTLDNHLAIIKRQRRKSESDLSSVLQGPAHELQLAQTRDHLAQFLRNKKDRHSLVEQGILLDEKCIAGSIQSNAKELERKLLCDRVEQELRHRPAKEELEKAGVIKEGIQGRRCSLEQEQKRIQLKRRLSDRPSPEELLQQHILEPIDFESRGTTMEEQQKFRKQISTKKKQKN